jgi:hypothetical protein
MGQGRSIRDARDAERTDAEAAGIVWVWGVSEDFDRREGLPDSREWSGSSEPGAVLMDQGARCWSGVGRRSAGGARRSPADRFGERWTRREVNAPMKRRGDRKVRGGDRPLGFHRLSIPATDQNPIFDVPRSRAASMLSSARSDSRTRHFNRLTRAASPTFSCCVPNLIHDVRAFPVENRLLRARRAGSAVLWLL